MISEIHNTPWGEITRYVHRVDQQTTPNSSRVHSDFKQKNMHVSPFFEMNYQYQIDFTNPKDSDDLMVSWKMQRENQNHFYAMMRLKGLPVTQRNLNHVLFGYPFMTLKVIIMIYWQAFCLYLKFPFVSHPSIK